MSTTEMIERLIKRIDIDGTFLDEVAARIEQLRSDLETAISERNSIQEAYIAATNPGIDMDRVRSERRQAE